MNKKNSFPKFKQNATLGTAQQYNAIVNYMITKKFGVKAAYITDYETLVKYLSELLWEIDPHYLKLKKRGMSFRNSRKNFLGFNDPSKHKHAVKNLCSESLVLKVQNLCNYNDRQYMNSSHMKTLQLILINVTEKLTAYLTELEEQNKRKKSHEKLCKTIIIEDFVIRSISTYTSIMENIWSNRFAKIRELFQNKDAYNPIVMNDLIQVTN